MLRFTTIYLSVRLVYTSCVPPSVVCDQLQVLTNLGSHMPEEVHLRALCRFKRTQLNE